MLSTSKSQSPQDQKITKDIHEAALTECRVAIEQPPDVDLLRNKRIVMLRYRGTDFECMVSSSLEETSLKLGCIMKGLAVEQGALAPLWVESQLVPTGHSVGKGSVDIDLLKEVTVARALAEAMVKDEGELSSDMVSEVLRNKESTLISLDRLFKIEISFMRQMVGAAGEKRLLDEVLALLPSAKQYISLEAGWVR